MKLALDQTAPTWDAIAESYEQKTMGHMAVCAVDVLRFAQIASGERVLDVATGPGTFAILAARAGTEVVAIDFSSTMIERLRLRVATEGFGNVTAAVMDGQSLDLPDNSFDAAVSLFGLIFFPDRRKGFHELWRVLRHGGRAAVSGWGPPQRMGPVALLGKALKRAVPDIPPPPGPPLAHSLADPLQFEREMLEAGFRDVRVHTTVYQFEFPSPKDTWEGLIAGTPARALLLERLDSAKLDKVGETLMAILRPEFGDGPVRLTAEANIGIGVK